MEPRDAPRHAVTSPLVGLAPLASRCYHARVRRRLLLPLIISSLSLSGCGKSARDPFLLPDGGADAATGDAADDTNRPDGPVDDAGQPLGKPCLDDPQCDDAIDCTTDRCDPDYRRCRNTPDDLACQNHRYCDGVEICDPVRGCIEGVPVTCSDTDSCTIDRCVESQAICTHELRDADGDGDPDYHCAGGNDCNDADPFTSSLVAEICGNAKDDDCNGQIDEAGCVTAAHDTCTDPAVASVGQQVVLSTRAAILDYAASCVPSGDPSLRDIVAAVTVPPGPPMNVDVVARADAGSVYAAAALQCNDASSELACGPSATTSAGPVARFIARNVPPSTFPVYLFSNLEQDIRLTVTLQAPEPAPTNETCGTALPITPGVPFAASIVGATPDLPSACSSPQGDLVFSFTTSDPHDVYVTATSLDGLGDPTISLRSDGCALAEDELACTYGPAPLLFRRALPPGTWYVSLGASGPTDVLANVQLAPPSVAPADENCEDAPVLVPNKTVSVPLAGHMDDVPGTCLAGASDAAYRIDLSEPSDVLLVERISQNDSGALSLFGSTCDASTLLGCEVSSPSPVRNALHNLPPGTYHAVVETTLGNPTTLTAFVRPVTPPTLVLFADDCSDVLSIPETGGSFQGNTRNATAQYPGSCDQGGGTPEGAPDQILRLELTARRRVILDMRGSGYRTLLDLRRGPSCPGEAMTFSCAVGYYPQRSYLDRTLDPGVYFIQIDGFAGDSGPWFLDVFTADP